MKKFREEEYDHCEIKNVVASGIDVPGLRLPQQLRMSIFVMWSTCKMDFSVPNGTSAMDLAYHPFFFFFFSKPIARGSVRPSGIFHKNEMYQTEYKC